MLTDRLVIQTLLLALALSNIPLVCMIFISQSSRKNLELKKMSSRSINESYLPSTNDAGKAVLYQELGRDLWTYKTSQWNIVYYASLIFGAAVGILYLLDNPKWIRILLLIAITVILDFSLHQLVGLQHEIREARIRMNKYNHELFRIGLYWKTDYEFESVMEDYSKFWRSSRYMTLFLLTVIIGFIASGLVIALLKWK
jgi:hypothetical protein